MRMITKLLLLALPVAEIWILILLFDEYGGWVLLYLIAMMLLGFQLVRGERLLISSHLKQSLRQGGNPIKVVLGSARNIIAGILLIIPGVITDIMAAILLLIPVNNTVDNATQYTQKAANDDIIEGEFRRED